MNERKNYPVFSGVIQYFPHALLYVAKVSKTGNDQHHPGTPLHWDKTKSTDEADALIRHAIDMGIDGKGLDADGILHAGKVAWRALANLERVLTERMEHEDTSKNGIMTGTEHGSSY